MLQMDDGRIVMIGDERTRLAAFIPLRIEHEAIDDTCPPTHSPCAEPAPRQAARAHRRSPSPRERRRMRDSSPNPSSETPAHIQLQNPKRIRPYQTESSPRNWARNWPVRPCAS